MRARKAGLERQLKQGEGSFRAIPEEVSYYVFLLLCRNCTCMFFEKRNEGEWLSYLKQGDM